MIHITDNLRITEQKGLIPPVIMLDDVPISQTAIETVRNCRKELSDIIHGKDDRLQVLIGPCSIHDMKAALEYGEKLLSVMPKYKDTLCIVMRVYFEKPRTTVGWKGFINDPNLDGSFEINKGLRLGRQLLLTLSEKGVPCGSEFLDVISPQFLTDLIAWGAIGARTTESQVHRELASGLSCPIGFKNGTDGGVQVAIDAVRAARSPHHFLGVTKQGNTAIFATTGNPDTHIILRGGKKGPNYDLASVTEIAKKLADAGLPDRMMVDCSHDNSQKDYRNQPAVAADIAKQVAAGSHYICGVMIESHLVAGTQNINTVPLEYGKSVTDGCISWEMTLPILQQLDQAVKARRAMKK